MDSPTAPMLTHRSEDGLVYGSQVCAPRAGAGRLSASVGRRRGGGPRLPFLAVLTQREEHRDERFALRA